ncbi:MAG: hypothetical protein KJ630_23390 [Proteobacteria bacterium]|nr:hypothetical protein [Pseudomonadota bacterium]
MERDLIQIRLRELEEEIAETIRRLPAHSVKPPVMIDLFALEDERDMLLKKLGPDEPAPARLKTLSKL